MIGNRKLRYTTTFISFMLFPVILNFLSPYVSVTGAMSGIVSGSLIVFAIMFLSGLFFGRAWCSHICPWAMPSDFIQNINNKTVNRKRLRVIRYSIFAIWATVLLLGFVFAGGIKEIDTLYLTETGISVDEPLKYIIYYFVLGTLFLTTILIGRRGACHSLCWMSPFLVLGQKAGEFLRLPQYKIRSNPDACISCQKCDHACPMSIDVMEAMKIGKIISQDCILCGDCVRACPKDVLSIKIER